MATDVSKSFLIRQATEDDLLRICDIFRDAFRLEANSLAELAAFRENCPHGMLVAQVGDEIAGATMVYVRDGRPLLHSTAVAREFRTHRGIGSGLVASQLSNFQKLGYAEMDTIIRCDNSISIKTGEKLGFKHVRTIRNFYDFPRGSARLYVKSLLPDGKIAARGPSLRDKAKDLWARGVEPRRNRGLRIAWFDDWRTTLDNALHELPEMEGCPHDLFRLIMQNPSSARKRTALVMEGDGPVAVVGLRERGRHWVPVLQGIIPGCVAAARDGYLFPALNALGVDVRIGDWPAPPPKSAYPRSAVAVPRYKVDCQGDYEKYWRDSTRLKAIKVARKRTESFRFEVDKPGSAALVIARWEEKWRDHPEQQTIVASDLTLAAEYWEKRGQWHSFLLMDGDVLAAGCTGPAHGDTLVYAVSIRDDRYTWHRAGFRLVDLVVPWAAEHGFAKFDVGGWYSYYKAKWGPQDGEHWDFRICPLRQHVREQVIWKARAVPSKVKGLLGWLPGISRTPEGDEGEDVGGSQAEDAPETESGDTGQVPSPIADASKGRNA